MSGNLRIAQYYPRALSGDGGMTNAVRQLSLAMSRRGADVTIVCEPGGVAPRDGNVRWRPIRHTVVSRHHLPARDELAAALRDVDVVVLNSAWTVHNVVAGRVAERAGVPYVVAPRGAYDPAIRRRHRLAKDLWWTFFERRLVMDSRALHVFFDSETEHLARLGYHGTTIAVPNGVEVPAGLRWDGGSGGYVLWLGRFDPEHKGLDMLLRAVAAIPPDRRPRLRLQGPEWRHGRERVSALIRELGVQSWVTVGNPVYGDEKWELVCRAAGFVYPSRWEAFGNSVAEAAALGVPCLVTPYPLGRLLADRGAAVLARADAGSLAEGLLTLQGDVARDLGGRARALLAESFSWDRVAEGWLQAIRRLVDEPDTAQPQTAGSPT